MERRQLSSVPADNTAEEECMDPIVVRVYTKEKIDYSLSILDGMVILAPVNPSDPLQ
ncbi:hypothetical protein Tco_0956748, partial [Tanacetum coccineum]